MMRDFVNYFNLDPWDWFSAIVAFFSLIVAIFAFIIAKRTLASQKQTEKNTMPIINIDIQEFLLKEFIFKLLDGQIRISAIWYLLHGKNYLYYPSEQILEKLKVSTESIHTELFYNRADDYLALQGLLNITIEYNINITVLNAHLSNNSIDNNLLYQEFDNIIKQNAKIAEIWGKVMTCIYNYDPSKTASVFAKLLNMINDNVVNYEYVLFKDNDDKYLDLLNDDNDKKKFLYYMDTSALKFIDEYEHFIIKKI